MSREIYATAMDIWTSSIAVTAAKRDGGENKEEKLFMGDCDVYILGIFRVSRVFGASWGARLGGGWNITVQRNDEGLSNHAKPIYKSTDERSLFLSLSTCCPSRSFRFIDLREPTFSAISSSISFLILKALIIKDCVVVRNQIRSCARHLQI